MNFKLMLLISMAPTPSIGVCNMYIFDKLICTYAIILGDFRDYGKSTKSI